MEFSQNSPTQIPQVYPAQNLKKPTLSYIAIILLSVALFIVSILLIYSSFYSDIIPFIWKTAPSYGNKLLTHIDVPIEPDGKIIQGIGALYKFNTEVKSITLNSKNEKVIQVTDDLKIPPIVIDDNTEVFIEGSRNIVTINSLKPGQKVSLFNVYRPVSKTWELLQVNIKK